MTPIGPKNRQAVYFLSRAGFFLLLFIPIGVLFASFYPDRDVFSLFFFPFETSRQRLKVRNQTSML